MSCEAIERNYLEVETDKAIYNFEFSEVQFEITGTCNMSCEHCRGAFDEKVDLPKEQVVKVLKFARKFSPNFKEVTISGGEPLLHKEFRELLIDVRNLGVTHLTLTTNGTYINREILEFIKSLEFNRVTFSISLDSIDPIKHNTFRNHKNAFEYAIRAFREIVNYNESSFYVSMRSTLLPADISSMENMVLFAISLGLNRISFSSVLPSGNAINKPDLWMDKMQLKAFSENLQHMHIKYGDRIHVSSNEPLKWISREREYKNEDGIIKIEGCPAGTISFNINSNGDMTPCSLFGLKMMNILDMTEDEIEYNYKNSKIVHELLDKNLKGNCGSCHVKESCVGCRARAYYITGDYLEQDSNCWLESN